ncbi:hypothetical protein BEH94_11750 [Candidatus Altiarchaeales archaeon WOR_SM1_SCG]|nr:hypothetical protein BEH94_11750 [Candidatus Altiarchaeales archaeon WOR_SM1_SCG]
MKIKIPLSKEQYKSLIKVIYLGEWLVNSYRIPPDRDKEIDEIAHYIFSYTKGFEVEDLLKYDKKFNKVFPTLKLEEMLHPGYVEEYDNEIFWDGLIQRLAERDFVNEYAEKEILKMEPVERIMKIEKLREKYNEEFVENGLENVIVKIN